MKGVYVDLPEGEIHCRIEGEGEPLLLFHQAPMSGEEWAGVMPLLSHRYRVIAPDMIGHGNSADPEREYEVEDFAATTLRLLDALEIEHAVVCGNHSGGALATAIALAAPERVRKLIVSCEMLISVEQIEAFLESLKDKPMSRDLPMDEEGRFLLEAWGRYTPLAPTANAETRFLPFVLGQMARLRPFDAHFAVMRWMAQEAWITQVNCPTLVVGAEHDFLYRQELMDGVASRIPGGRAHTITNAGALSTFERPEAWAAAIRDFI